MDQKGPELTYGIDKRKRALRYSALISFFSKDHLEAPVEPLKNNAYLQANCKN